MEGRHRATLHIVMVQLQLDSSACSGRYWPSDGSFGAYHHLGTARLCVLSRLEHATSLKKEARFCENSRGNRTGASAVQVQRLSPQGGGGFYFPVNNGPNCLRPRLLADAVPTYRTYTQVVRRIPPIPPQSEKKKKLFPRRSKVPAV